MASLTTVMVWAAAVVLTTVGSAGALTCKFVNTSGAALISAVELLIPMQIRLIVHTSNLRLKGSLVNLSAKSFLLIDGLDNVSDFCLLDLSVDYRLDNLM